jgi:hypothetical protein
MCVNRGGATETVPRMCDDKTNPNRIAAVLLPSTAIRGGGVSGQMAGVGG